MATSAKLVKALRERTGLGIMDCKAALDECGGDLAAAVDFLRKKSALKAARKSGRTAAQGLLGLHVSGDGKYAALVEVNIETDFAARNAKFQAFVDKVAAAAPASKDVAALAAAFEDERAALVQEIGENIGIRRMAALRTGDGLIGFYLHTDARKGALVELSLADAELGKDLAMHVTAHDPTPLVVRGEDLDEAVVAKEREVFAAQAAAAGKPAAIVKKIIAGRLRKFLAEVSLLEQPFVKDGERKVGKLLAAKGAEVRRFVRLQVGEGIAVAQDDFAAEVAAQASRAQSA